MVFFCNFLIKRHIKVRYPEKHDSKTPSKTPKNDDFRYFQVHTFVSRVFGIRNHRFRCFSGTRLGEEGTEVNSWITGDA
jgi:hypothetical protein